MHPSQVEPIVCRSYTHGRRYPLVIGKLSGWTPWWGPATPAQYGVGVGSLLALLATRRLWGHLPGVGNLVVLLTVPFLLAWSVRAARFEGRTPARALLGLLTYASVPRGGRLRGRPFTEPKLHRVDGGRLFVVELPPGALGQAPAVGRAARRAERGALRRPRGTEPAQVPLPTEGTG